MCPTKIQEHRSPGKENSKDLKAAKVQQAEEERLCGTVWAFQSKPQGLFSDFLLFKDFYSIEYRAPVEAQLRLYRGHIGTILGFSWDNGESNGKEHGKWNGNILGLQVACWANFV